MDYKTKKDLLNTACSAYYLLREEIMSDSEYDIMYQELLSMELSQDFADEDSPTQRVGYRGLVNEKPHEYGRVLSLDNVLSPEELSKFFKGKVKDMIVMPKLDGLAMVLYYTGGNLVRALLRGDGVEGSDVTPLAIQMDGVPLTIDIKDSFRIAGEIVCFHDRWITDYKNHRNYVSGSMNLVDETKFKTRGLSFVSFDTNLSPKKENTFFDRMMQLSNINGIMLVDYMVDSTGDDQDDLRVEFRKFFQFCDGLVYAQNDLTILLGATSHHPYNKVAYKFPPVEVETELLDVIWQMGRTKTLTPVAVLGDVILDGATVNRASLCNLNNIAERNICIGDTVIVRKAGEIIPQVTKIVKAGTPRIKITIKSCPKCMHDVHVTPTGLVSCVNPDCEGGAGAAINHFCKAVGIKGLGKTICGQLADNMDITEVLLADDSDLCDHSNIAAANAPKVVESIKESYSAPRWKAWVGLGIPNCGKSLCERLEVETLFALSYERLMAMSKVADITATHIMNFVEDNGDLIEFIESKYTVIVKPLVISEDAQKVYITGTLSQSRVKIKTILEATGKYKVMSSLSKNTDMILIGKGAKTAKIDKARELNVQVVEEANLI